MTTDAAKQYIHLKPIYIFDIAAAIRPTLHFLYSSVLIPVCIHITPYSGIETYILIQNHCTLYLSYSRNVPAVMVRVSVKLYINCLLRQSSEKKEVKANRRLQ